MGHYDSTCPHCGHYGMFSNIDCSCPGAREALDKLVRERKAALAEARAVLEPLKCPIGTPFDPMSYEATRYIKVAEWAKGLLK